MRPFILGIEGLKLTDAERGLFSEAPPFGVILFLRNIDNPDQLRALIDDIKTVSGGRTLLFIDQEGGRVQRLAPPYWALYPIAGELAKLDGEAFERAVYAIYRLIGDDLAQAGFDVDCAPCLDLLSEKTATFLRDRSFGSDRVRIIKAGQAACRGLLDAGIQPVLKHLPGHGPAQVDSHLELPYVVFDGDPYGGIPPDDVQVFLADYGADMAMTAHILYPQIDKKNPLTLSRKGIEFLRKNIGFDGLIMSDDIAMKALKGSQGALALQTLEAGVDLALACSGEIADIREIYSLDIEANERLLRANDKFINFRKKSVNALGKGERAELNDAIRLA